MREDHRTLEVLGDRWTLLIRRDIIFGGARRFRELLRSQERIASNILADRLRMLVEAGLLTRSGDPNQKQKAVYSLREGDRPRAGVRPDRRLGQSLASGDRGAQHPGKIGSERTRIGQPMLAHGAENQNLRT
jgi:DNA-binding HxlR family transcriptional regulator